MTAGVARQVPRSVPLAVPCHRLDRVRRLVDHDAARAVPATPARRPSRCPGQRRCTSCGAHIAPRQGRFGSGPGVTPAGVQPRSSSPAAPLVRGPSRSPRVSSSRSTGRTACSPIMRSKSSLIDGPRNAHACRSDPALRPFLSPRRAHCAAPRLRRGVPGTGLRTLDRQEPRRSRHLGRDAHPNRDRRGHREAGVLGRRQHPRRRTDRLHRGAVLPAPSWSRGTADDAEITHCSTRARSTSARA